MILRLLPLLFLVPVVGFAQANDSTAVIKRLQFGPVGGGMNYEVEFTPGASVEPFAGTSFGAGLRYFDNKLVGFQAELSYTNAGWRENIDAEYSSTGEFTSLYERQTQYAELLILTQLSIGNGFIQPMLQAGPYVSFPVGETTSIPSEYVAPDTTSPLYYDLDLPFRINYGTQIGAGLNVEIGPLTIQAEGRYLIGFSDLIKTGTTVAASSRRQGLGWHVGAFWALRPG